jgi:signal transduction histidine kinase
MSASEQTSPGIKPVAADQAAHITQELYKQNLELAERNKTLALLRKIDEIVLSSVTNVHEVADRITQLVVTETAFIVFNAVLLSLPGGRIVPYGAAYRVVGSSRKLKEQERFFSNLPIRSASNPIAQAITKHQTVAVDHLTDVISSPFPHELAQQIQSAVGIRSLFVSPLTSRGRTVGVLIIGSQASKPELSEYQLKVIERLSGVVAIALDNSLLYQKTEDTTNRLRVANRHLKELDRAKDEFISMASHQLRTPLTTIKGYLSMMLEGDAGRLTKPQREFVGYAFGSSERMVNLISDLLNVSRLSAGRFLIQTKPTDMVQMIDDEVRQLATHATAKGIKLIFEHPSEPLPPAEIDDNKTRQVIMNFIDNAIYYTPEGEIHVMLKQSGDQVRFEVRDSGIGVPDNAKHKLFSKFYRADNAQQVRPDGTGLGLYLAKRVIEDQGGTIIFSSVEGKGSTFGFELPFKPQPAKHEDKHHGRHHTH